MKTFIISAIAAMALGVISCNTNTPNTAAATTDSGRDTTAGNKGKITVGQKQYYVCEMDTDVISDKPGNCPKCGMELKKKMLPDTTKTTIK